MEKCSNCGSKVGDLETLYLWQGRIVCRLCNSKFTHGGTIRLHKAFTIALIALVAVLVGMLYIQNRRAASTEGHQIPSFERTPFEERLSALKAENDRLMARLARLESSTQAVQPTSVNAISTPRLDSPSPANGPVFDSPQSVVLAYISAATWQDRLPCVANATGIRARMEKTYEVVGATGTQAVQFEPEKYKQGKIQTPKQQTDGRFLVAVDMSGLDVKSIFEFVVVKESDGFKIDWLASRELMDRLEKEKFISDWGLANAVLRVKVLKVEQDADYTKMTIQVTNASGAFLSFWSVSAAVYDGGGTFLANADTNGSNLRPNSSAISEILMNNVDATKVTSWKLALGGMTAQKDTGETLSDVEKGFVLLEVK